MTARGTATRLSVFQALYPTAKKDDSSPPRKVDAAHRNRWTSAQEFCSTTGVSKFKAERWRQQERYYTHQKSTALKHFWQQSNSLKKAALAQKATKACCLSKLACDTKQNPEKSADLCFQCCHLQRHQKHHAVLATVCRSLALTFISTQTLNAPALVNGSGVSRMKRTVHVDAAYAVRAESNAFAFQTWLGDCC